MKKVCLICGSAFETTNDKKKYCSLDCKREADRIRLRKKHHAERGYDDNAIRVCEVCGREIVGRNVNAKTCSTFCAKQLSNYEYGKQKIRPHGQSEVPEERKKLCKSCGNIFIDESRCINALYCSLDCKKEAERKKDAYKYKSMSPRQRSEFNRKNYLRKHQNAKTKKEISCAAWVNKLAKLNAKNKIVHKYCAVCGTHFMDYKNGTAKTCSPDCSKEYKKQQNRLRADSRLNDRNIIDSNITLKRLYERDNGICYICGGKCDFDDYSTNENGAFVCGPNYPTIEHVIPISRGGMHSWKNVMLAHHSCNASKSDNYPVESAVKLAMSKEIIPKKERTKGKTVFQYSADMEFVAVYSSTADAERKTGFKQKQIQSCARGECETYRGYIWKYYTP